MARGIWGRGTWSMWSLFWRTKDDAPEPVVVEESRLTEAPSSGAKRKGGGSGAKRDPSQSVIKRIGLALTSGGGGGRNFESPEDFTFDDITNTYNREGYVRQAIDKYIELMFKAGWDFVGKNSNAVEYVRMRFKLMAEASQIPTQQLFIEVAEDLVKYHNVFIAKKRDADPIYFGGLAVVGVGDRDPVAAYFPLNVSTMQVQRDQYGTVKAWQQQVQGQGQPKRFRPEDIVHYYYKREKGKAFGYPFLVPALDDIRALRQMEENILRLVYRNLHPLWHIKVGLDKPEMYAEPEEVEQVRQATENMDPEGGFVTNERVSIASIASNQIIDAKEYLKHFEQRVFTDLGVSELMMGRGNTANRSTGDNLSGEFTDRCKAFQRVQEIFTNDFMINEILLEGGFDPIMNPDDAVHFKFYEIDTDSQIKKENQAVFLYEHNAISEDEMRTLLGRDPVDDGEGRAKMHLNVVTIPELEVQAEIKAAQAAATGGAGGSKTPSSTKKKAATDNKTKPTNQHGTKSSPKKATNSLHAAYLREMHGRYTEFNEAVLSLIDQYNTYVPVESTLVAINLQKEIMSKMSGAVAYIRQELLNTTSKFFGEEVTSEVEIPLRRMVKDIHEKVVAAMVDPDTKRGREDIAEVTQALFDVFLDRLGAIATKTYDLYVTKKEVADDEENEA